MIREIVGSDLLMLTLTVGFYCAATSLYRRARSAIFHPVLLTFLAMIVFLKLTGIDYSRYREATKILDFGLGLSVVALGYLMYEQLEHMRGRMLPILTSTLVGSVIGILSVVYIAKWLGADRTIMVSVAPKSVTMPIAVAVAEPLDAILPITSIVVFTAGIFGSIAGVWILKMAGVKDKMAQGFALGSGAHGIGTARAIELGAVEGALSGLAMALMGTSTALLLPFIEKYMF